jgi:hypothetical protein
MIKSIWFQSKQSHERDAEGVAMVDMLESHVDDCLEGSKDEAFKDIVFPYNEVKFYILVCHFSIIRYFECHLLTLSFFFRAMCSGLGMDIYHGWLVSRLS